ncbi:MAG: hypothetical protein QXE81_03775 [Desulfurococcaceae archaeon]
MILSKPIPIEEYRKEAEEVINLARVEAEKIIEESRRIAEKIKNIDREKFEKAVMVLQEYILGMRNK